ncbi:unnamed protein product [Phytophthora fragariaefolia]|uniref:Unnamed protein product n=1 Tax=Phytophthora fragariaefolia TaxID=1490495 RepID=A0A9W6XU41_9STRA|nr:unnamed protein product [Phytophthora fragariaefolia]
MRLTMVLVWVLMRPRPRPQFLGQLASPLSNERTLKTSSLLAPIAAESLSDVVDVLAPISRSPAPWEDEISELRDDVASLEMQLTASEASLHREVDLRLKAERLCNQASQGRNAALENHRWLRLDHTDASRQLVATNIELEQSTQATAALEQRCRPLDKSLADTHKVIRQYRAFFKAGIVP